MCIRDSIRPLLQTKEALTLAAYDVAKQAALENVVYIEVRFAPELSMDQGLTVPETIDAVCDGLRQAQEEFGIVAKALVCGMRQSDQEVTSRILAEANQVSDQDFVGFDFAGDEHNYSPEDIRPLIEQVKSYHCLLYTSAHELNREISTLQISLVNISDFKLSTRAWFDVFGNFYHIIVIEIKSCHCKVRFWMFWFFLDRDSIQDVYKRQD